MSIVFSEAIIDHHTQQGGGRYVVERHTDAAGEVHQVGPYLAPEGFDVAGRMAARATQMGESLAEAEAIALLNDGT